MRCTVKTPINQPTIRTGQYSARWPVSSDRLISLIDFVLFCVPVVCNFMLSIMVLRKKKIVIGQENCNRCISSTQLTFNHRLQCIKTRLGTKRIAKALIYISKRILSVSCFSQWVGENWPEYTHCEKRLNSWVLHFDASCIHIFMAFVLSLSWHIIQKYIWPNCNTYWH